MPNRKVEVNTWSCDVRWKGKLSPFSLHIFIRKHSIISPFNFNYNFYIYLSPFFISNENSWIINVRYQFINLKIFIIFCIIYYIYSIGSAKKKERVIKYKWTFRLNCTYLCKCFISKYEILKTGFLLIIKYIYILNNFPFLFLLSYKRFQSLRNILKSIGRFRFELDSPLIFCNKWEPLRSCTRFSTTILRTMPTCPRSSWPD